MRWPSSHMSHPSYHMSHPSYHMRWQNPHYEANLITTKSYIISYHITYHIIPYHISYHIATKTKQMKMMTIIKIMKCFFLIFLNTINYPVIFDKVDENNFCFKYLVKEIYKKVWAITKPATTKEQTIKKMSRKSIKGLNFDISDEPELSDYNELTFDELIGNRIKTEKNILYKKFERQRNRRRPRNN